MRFDVLNENELWHVIRATYTCAWENRIDENDVKNWLDNFNGGFFCDVDLERKIALWLLTHFSFYTENNIRALCKEVYSNFIHKLICIDENDSLDIDSILKQTMFVPIGTPSESGAYITYIFRTANDLGIELFSSDENRSIKNIVYIDDATLSGSQFVSFAKNNELGINGSAQRFFLLTLFSTEESRREITKSYNDLEIIYASGLDQRDKVFAKESYIFSDEEYLPIKEDVRNFCLHYGCKAVTNKNNALGYKNGQYMIGFEHNTPNNTLPIFWSSVNWKPIFRRFPKRYSKARYEIDERKYY